MVRILGIGDNTVDMYVDHGVRFPGGNAVNVAVQCRRLGAEAAYLGCLGNDAGGDLIAAALREEGLGLDRLRRIDGPNAWCRIRHRGADRVFAGSIPGVRGRYDLDEADGAYLAGFDVVHTSISSDLDGDIDFLRRHARLLSYDFSEYWTRPGVAAVLPKVDIAFLSAPKAGEAECRALLAEIHGRGVGDAVVLTRGVRGSLALVDDTVHVGGIVPVEVVDTLGAGDAFIAGFLVSYGEHHDPRRALALGAETAARACTYRGGFGHESPIPEDGAAD
jgi:fructoselysine 6-kinase